MYTYVAITKVNNINFKQILLKKRAIKIIEIAYISNL